MFPQASTNHFNVNKSKWIFLVEIITPKMMRFPFITRAIDLAANDLNLKLIKFNLKFTQVYINLEFIFRILFLFFNLNVI